MKRKPWWHGLAVWLWFAVVIGMTVRIGDAVRVWSLYRTQRLQLQKELRRLQKEITVLENKLRFLYTPEGVRFVQRAQYVGTDNERLFVIENGLPPISIIDLLPGGLEEWHDDGQRPASWRNRWLTRLSRHWQHLRGARSPQ